MTRGTAQRAVLGTAVDSVNASCTEGAEGSTTRRWTATSKVRGPIDAGQTRTTNAASAVPERRGPMTVPARHPAGGRAEA
jgi:hypothetical protein